MRSDFVLELPTELEAIERAVSFLLERGEEAGFERDRLRLNFRVGLTEALVNAVLYGNDGDRDKCVRVEAAFDRDRAVVRVTDEGRGFDPRNVPDPTLPHNRDQAGGRGVFLIRALMDEVEYNDRGNSVTMVLERGGARKPAPTLAPADRTTLAQEIERVVEHHRRAFPQRRVRVWARTKEGWAAVYPGGPDSPRRPPGDAFSTVASPLGFELALEVDDDPSGQELLARTLEMVFAYEDEARSAAREIAERYEEINLLYSISEVLGSVVSLPAAAQKILSEVAETLGGRRASIWIHDERSNRLVLAAAVGDGGTPDSISVEDPNSVTARVFRERAPLNVERGAEIQRGNNAVPRPSDEAFVSVPISYSPPEGDTRIIGVITLIGRRHHERFSAGDARLLSAVASQVGAALETQRLMEESVRRQRFQRELELAHDLQMKLLPSTEDFQGRINIAARCTPADSVGGDFYHLVRLTDSRCAVVIGDVSSHGFAAAMIMALTMSAIGIYARETDRPAEVLRHLHRALVKELESTEMYMTIWYGVIDADERSVTYANAGHPHAFVLRADGSRVRMDATNPPLGLLPLSEYGEGVIDWDPAADLICLFTDGLSDALGAGKASGEGELLDRVAALASESSEAILARVFADAQNGTDLPPDDRTALIIRG